MFLFFVRFIFAVFAFGFFRFTFLSTQKQPQIAVSGTFLMVGDAEIYLNPGVFLQDSL